MKINPVNNLSYSQKLSLKGNLCTTATAPFVVEAPKSDDRYSFECANEYRDNVLNALNERKDELYDYLDSLTDDDGLTFTDKLADMFDMETGEIKEETFLHKTSSENVEDLEENGFNPDKIGRTEYGPGFYVGVSEGALLIYPGVKMQVKYKGNLTV